MTRGSRAPSVNGVKRTGVNVNNSDFGPEVVTTLKEDRLCVPSTVSH